MTKVFGGILVLVRELHVALHAYHATLPKINFKTFRQKKKILPTR